MIQSKFSRNRELGLSRDRLAKRAAPFGVVAVFAEITALFLPRPHPIEFVISAAILLAAGLSLGLPWERFPRRSMILPPLALLVSMTLLIHSGGGSEATYGTVTLIPLLWVALYHRPWESAVTLICVIVALFIASIQEGDPGPVDLRRISLAIGVGLLISVSVHFLRRDLNIVLDEKSETLRQTISLRNAARDLTSILDPADIVTAATSLATQLLPPREGGYCYGEYVNIIDGIVFPEARSDESPSSAPHGWLLQDDPLLQEALITHMTTSGQLTPSVVGPSLRPAVASSGITHETLVPVLPNGQLDGILTIKSSGYPITQSLIEQLTLLGNVIELALANALRFGDVTHDASTDSMTGLANRRAFYEQIANRPGREPFAILVMDLDGLKQVNDQFGHDAGDAFIISAARAFERVMRKGDTLARMGGDEFAAFLFGATEEFAQSVCDRMVHSLEEASESELRPNASIGFACGGPEDDPADVYSRADDAMYAAKRTGGARWVAAIHV